MITVWSFSNNPDSTSFFKRRVSILVRFLDFFGIRQIDLYPYKRSINSMCKYRCVHNYSH
ncbi:hypothetical protein ALT1000_200039 [Alteromonas macleodii]